MTVSPINIVYLHAHDAGRYVEPYGFSVKTPNLMTFAQEGVLFRKAYCAAPTCGPSRSAMMAGQYPHQIGMYGLPGNADGWAFDDYNEHLVRVLADHGYETVLAGCQHETGKSDEELQQDLGYRRLLNNGRERKGQFYQETIDHVERYLAEPKTGPFFLSVGIDEPHRNNQGRPEIGVGNECSLFAKTRYYDPDRLDYRYVAPPPFLPDLPAFRKDMASYHEGVRLMDEYMGRVLYALKHYGYEQNTLVIITTDHGIEFPGGKMTLSDQGIGVMLMMRGPGGFTGGQVIESLVSQLDLYPTLCELLHIGRKPWLQGTSLLPLVRGETDAIHEEIYAEQTYHGGFEPLRCVRTERFKLVRRHLAEGPKIRAAVPYQELMKSIGFYNRPLGHLELFDLYLDPLEHHNVADQPEYKEVRKRLEVKLDSWMEETRDPFPSGEFPKQGSRAAKHE